MYFLKLIRPLNLIIIGITMMGVVLFSQKYNTPHLIDSVDLCLLIGSTILIGAAGNIINDYFDVRADRLNKPTKLIIGKHVKRRWAIVSHWMFNIIAFIIALYLGWKYQSIWFPFVHITSITILWWYSTYLKKKALIGNLFVSFLTGLVIILSWYFMELQQVDQTTHSSSQLMTSLGINFNSVLYFFILFAVILNMAREIVKDIEDIPGDHKIGAFTLPMIIGERYSLYSVGVLALLLPLALVYHSVNTNIDLFGDIWPLSIASLVNIIIVLLTLFKINGQVQWIKHLIKISMLSGIIYLYL